MPLRSLHRRHPSSTTLPIGAAVVASLITLAACAPTSSHAQASAVPAQVAAARRPLPGAPVGVTAFVGVTVVPMDTERVLANQTVLVKDGWITGLGPADKVKVPTEATRVAGQGKYLMPGLADMHVHIHGTLAPDLANADQLMASYLADGVTTVRNMDHMQDTRATVMQLRDRINAGEAVGPRIYTSGRWRPAGMNPRGPYPPEEIAARIDEYKTAGYDHVKVYSWDTGAMFDSITAAANRVGLPVTGHIPGGVTVRHALKAGMKSFEHNYGYFDKSPGGTIFEPDVPLTELAKLTQDAGAWNCPTYFWWHPDRARINKALQDADAGLLLGTDGAAGRRGDENKYIPRHLEELVKAGLTPYQALAAGTRNVAAYFGTLDSTGTVAPGKRADLILLTANPLENVRNTAMPAGVMVAGRWLDYQEIKRRMEGNNASGAASP